MTNLGDVAKDNNVNLEDSVVFVKGDDDILSVDIKNVGIKQRADDTMGVRFSSTSKLLIFELTQFSSAIAIAHNSLVCCSFKKHT